VQKQKEYIFGGPLYLRVKMTQTDVAEILDLVSDIGLPDTRRSRSLASRIVDAVRTGGIKIERLAGANDKFERKEASWLIREIKESGRAYVERVYGDKVERALRGGFLVEDQMSEANSDYIRFNRCA
jgi:hypothetical protein